MLNKNQSGAAGPGGLFMIRHKTRGLYFKPEYRSSDPWADHGKVYKTLGAAKSSVKGMLRSTRASYTPPQPTEVEIVEFVLTETNTHTVNL